MKRRDVLKAIAGGAALVATGEARAATPPNIIVLLADDMTIEQLGRMPQVAKRLAATGVIFQNAYSCTPICQPARATILTGQWSHNNGIITNTTPYTNLDPATCMPKQLQLAGYKTCHVGKFLNTYLVNDNGGAVPAGWDEWHAISPQSYYSYSINDNGVITSRGTTEADYHTTVCNDRAVSFINSATQPFYMQVCYKAPHYQTATLPLATPGNYTATPNLAYTGVVPGATAFPATPNYNALITNPPTYMNLSAIDAPTLSAITSFWQQQTETLFALDRSVQAIMDALVAAGKGTNTYVFFLSDNGYMHAEHRDPYEKYVPYLTSSQVPLVISGPAASVAQGAVCDQLVSQADIATTIYALSGATSVRALDGISLVDTLASPHGFTLRTALLVESQAINNLGALTVPVYSGVITTAYAYFSYPASGETELYDLIADPWQLTNQTANSAYAAVKATLAAQLVVLKTCAGNSCVI